MRRRDHTSELCFSLAMAATAYANHRGGGNAETLKGRIDAIQPLLPTTTQLPTKEAARSLVASALSYGRSAGLDWHEMRELFNQATEQIQFDREEAFSQVQKAVRGEAFQ